MAKHISIVNFKGGVGKTTLAFHLGTGLARYHNETRVLLIDMDHQSSLSIVCLGANRWKESVDNQHTVDEIFRPFVDQESTSPNTEIIIKSPMKRLPQWQSRHYMNMDIVPAGLHLDDTEIELTASHHGNAIRSEWDKRTLVCRWIEETGIDDLYDYIIFDCPPATKIVSQNAIAASHGYIIPVVPEAVMERGAPHLHEMIRTGIDRSLNALAAMGEPRRSHVPDTKLVGVVVTRIQTAGGSSGYTNDHTQHLSSLRRQWGNKLVKTYVVQGTGVSQALADGVPVYDRDTTQNVGRRGLDRQFSSVTDELKTRIDNL